MSDPVPIRIEVLVFDGCPHADAALDLARTVTSRLRADAEVIRVDVDTDEKARAVGFLGSPSIRVNGVDIERKTTDEGSLCCRTYDGGSGVPPEWLVEAALLRALRPRHVLFMCVANSARSQLAEGIARSLAPPDVRISSAGSEPTSVRPLAIAALAEIGIDIRAHRSKTVADIDVDSVDAVITLCAEEVCPVFPRAVLKIHWGLPDPAAATGDEPARLAAFRDVRDELRRRLGAVFAD